MDKLKQRQKQENHFKSVKQNSKIKNKIQNQQKDQDTKQYNLIKE
jgi:hypothetical protein